MSLLLYFTVLMLFCLIKLVLLL